MAIDQRIRKLRRKWDTSGWPKRLEWIEIRGIRGWSGQRISFEFPIVAIVGENGAGKSTILQSAASSYRAKDGGKPYFASDFFPDTAWEKVQDASIRYGVIEGADTHVNSVRKPTKRWLGNPRRRFRPVVYLDLRRTQPISARVGYLKLAKSNITEAGATPFDEGSLKRFSGILGRSYQTARHSTTQADASRPVAVVSADGAQYSAFHQGAGETAVADLLAVIAAVPKYGLVLIDEIETSLHPRAQRRLVRDLADVARVNELQIICTTHSPYILDELPARARIYVANSLAERQVVKGVTPDFAMSKLDDEGHPEVDVFVEDTKAAALLDEILYVHGKDLVLRVQTIPCGPASVGLALGQMVANNRFPRPTVVVLDGDQEVAPGVVLLPGDDVPERVVFTNLDTVDFAGLAAKISRGHADVVDACKRAATNTNHHEWVSDAGNELLVGGDQLWRAMCSCWADSCASRYDLAELIAAIRDVLPE